MAALQMRRALVVGGTSGIGRGVALWLAGQQVHVTVAGRSAERGGAVVDAMRAAWADGEHEFVPVDAFSIAALGSMCRTYASAHNRLDFLVMTQGMATLQGFTPTDSGLDQKLTLHHFGRVACILGMKDLLAATAAQPGTDVRVLSVLSAGTQPTSRAVRRTSRWMAPRARSLASPLSTLALALCAPHGARSSQL